MGAAELSVDSGRCPRWPPDLPIGEPRDLEREQPALAQAQLGDASERGARLQLALKGPTQVLGQLGSGQPNSDVTSPRVGRFATSGLSWLANHVAR